MSYFLDANYHRILNGIIKYLCLAKLKLKGVAHLKYICPYKVRKTITEGIFKSVHIYCLPVYGCMEIGLIKDIQILYNKAARLVCHFPPQTARREIFEKLEWMTLRQLIVYHTLIAVFKIRQAKEPEYLESFLNNESRNKRIFIPTQSLSLAYESFCFRGSRHWNLLPSNLRTETEFCRFKNNLKSWIISNVPMFYD